MSPAVLAPLPAPEQLYDYRQGEGDGVPLWWPYNQGDVFEGVHIPGINYEDDDVAAAMLFLHPCTMRGKGGLLEPRLTVVRVSYRSKRVLDGGYFNSPKLLPLPDLYCDNRTFEGSLMEMGVVDANSLARTRRVAALSQDGRIGVLQRVIFHLTRFPVPPERLAQALQDVHAEVELQTDWLEAAWNRLGPFDLSGVERVEKEFGDLLDQPGRDASDESDTFRHRLYSDDDNQRSDAVTHVREVIESGVAGTCMEEI